ncbi:SURF1 family cytochrome oxidase biogenesis protein [Sphingomonas sp. 28-63-12]|uniref:SURF1 family cytochrome oxidase biogenesis protein n=1 Tax=Sphingomonas sp. 28-63-12 TaxID=1970434 RepID=UPI000BC7C4D6|nr:MAG: hypothetical protein B7Y47_09515 [Sphingomonas sp. 28-63-12]
MKRLPVIASLVVALAVAAMIALGCWQIFDRLPKKEAFLVQLAANPARPPIAFPAIPTDKSLLYRRTSAFCLQPTRWKTEGAGRFGWRYIAQCRTGAEGPGFAVEIGISRDPNARPIWRGGAVTGIIALAPVHRSLIGNLFDKAPDTLMIVADVPPPGFTRAPRPTIESIPNNHLAYGVQWFLFAGIALAIYALALRRRWRDRDVAG